MQRAAVVKHEVAWVGPHGLPGSDHEPMQGLLHPQQSCSDPWEDQDTSNFETRRAPIACMRTSLDPEFEKSDSRQCKLQARMPPPPVFSGHLARV